MKRKGLKTRQLHLLLSPEDYQLLQDHFAASASPVFSAWCRDMLLARPVILRYHNPAADEFLLIALELKHELVNVIHELRAAPEPRLADLISKVEELKLIMHQIYQQWSSG